MKITEKNITRNSPNYHCQDGGDQQLGKDSAHRIDSKFEVYKLIGAKEN